MVIMSRPCSSQNSIEVGDPGHGAVVVHDLAEHPGRVQAGHAGQVDGGLGVAGPLEHAALGVAQREDVPGSGEVAGAGGRDRSALRMVAERSAAEMPVLVPCR